MKKNRISAIFISLLIFIIRLYQQLISPYIGLNCRYLPSCSQYSIEALKTHGLFNGFYMSINRILRCHPWGNSGHDPIPNKKKN